jgi:uncharacterized LabA/DUF88 family protein
MMQKINNYAFIDSQNLNLAIRGQGWVLDFGKFRRYMKDRFSVEEAFLFVGYVEGNQFLYTNLQKLGYIVIFKPTLSYTKDGELHTKGNVDADLVLHTMIEYPNYDKAIVVSGDGDFYCLVDYLIQQEKFERLIIPNKYKYSALLRKFSSFITFLNGTREKLGRQTQKAA